MYFCLLVICSFVCNGAFALGTLHPGSVKPHEIRSFYKRNLRIREDNSLADLINRGNLAFAFEIIDSNDNQRDILDATGLYLDASPNAHTLFLLLDNIAISEDGRYLCFIEPDWEDYNEVPLTLCDIYDAFDEGTKTVQVEYTSNGNFKLEYRTDEGFRPLYVIFHDGHYLFTFTDTGYIYPQFQLGAGTEPVSNETRPLNAGFIACVAQARFWNVDHQRGRCADLDADKMPPPIEYGVNDTNDTTTKSTSTTSTNSSAITDATATGHNPKRGFPLFLCESGNMRSCCQEQAGNLSAEWDEAARACIVIDDCALHEDPRQCCQDRNSTWSEPYQCCFSKNFEFRVLEKENCTVANCAVYTEIKCICKSICSHGTCELSGLPPVPVNGTTTDGRNSSGSSGDAKPAVKGSASSLSANTVALLLGLSLIAIA